MRDELRVLLERIVAACGGNMSAADRRAGLNPGTISKWTTQDIRPEWDSRWSLGEAFGDVEGVSYRSLLVAAGYRVPTDEPVGAAEDALLTDVLRFKMRDAKTKLTAEDYDLIMSVLEQQVGMLAEARRRGQLRLPKRQINYDGDGESSRDRDT